MQADVETTAYALLTYVFRNDTAGALPLVRWLATQRNEYGGFSSTQVILQQCYVCLGHCERRFSGHRGGSPSFGRLRREGILERHQSGLGDQERRFEPDIQYQPAEFHRSAVAAGKSSTLLLGVP